jgi:hypothetical protein
MSDSSADALNVIKEHIMIISKQVTSPASYNVGSEAAKAIAMSFAFILGLALNDFFVQLFAKIPVGGGLLGAGIYAAIALIICLLMMFLIYAFLEPWLRKKFAKK